MAKRSDFSQKLLDDLRLRKEKLGFAQSQSSKQPAARPDNKAYRNSQWSSQSLGEATPNDLKSKNILNTAEVTKIWLGTRHHKTPAREGDIIPFSRTRAEHTTDVSMALALALSSSGKLQNIELYSNAMVGNKLIQHRGTIDFKDMNGRRVTNRLRFNSDQFPFLSNLQLGEISKGVQNLQKILKACSNGYSISRDSIDIGRELLKGAMDLEDSLRMLVTLQESSDNMVGSQGKPLRLLKGKEEDESSSHEKKQQKVKNRTRLSFDGSSRHFHEVVMEENNSNILEQSTLDLSRPRMPKDLKSNSNKSSSNASTQFISHRRSQSCGPGSKVDAQTSSIKSRSSQNHEDRSFSDTYNNSSLENIRKLGPTGSSMSEKVRIPNVVAKLMGLEELPVPKAEVKNSEVQRVSNSKKVSKTCMTLIPNADTSKKEADKMLNSRNYGHKLNSGKKLLYGSFVKNKVTESPEAKRKLNQKHLDSMKNTSMTANYPPKSHIKVHKQMDTANIDHTREATKAENTVAAFERGTLMKEKYFNGKFEQIASDSERSPIYSSRSYDEAIRKQELTQTKKNLILPSNLPQTAKDNVSTHRSETYMSKCKNAVHRSGKETEHDSHKTPQTTVAEKSDPKLKKVKSTYGIKTENVLSSGSTVIASKRSANKSATAEQVKEYPKKSNNRKEGTTRKKNSTYHDLDRETANGNSEGHRALKKEPISDLEKSIPPLQVAAVIRKQVHIPFVPKEDTSQVITQVKENKRRIEEEPSRSEALHVKGQHSKQQPSILQELERRWKEKTRKAEEQTMTFCSMNSEQHLEQKTLLTTPCSPPADDCTKPTVIDHNAAEDAPNGPIEYADQQSQGISHEKDFGLPLFNLNENWSEGSTDGKHLSKCETLIIDTQQPLTEKECILKQILVSSQTFLSTARALFNLEIPVGLLQASEEESSKLESKILLDCGYEVMRRKGQLKPRGLDALIRELSGDIESLKFRSENGFDEYDAAAECLHRMLERDIHNRNPDINCMWDFGWSCIAFADVERSEIARDVEKNVLDMLISELTSDLFHNVGITTW